MRREWKSSVKVWDPLVRVFHWLLVFFFAMAYFLEDALPLLHVNIGYAVLVLLVFRLLWGVIGTRYALFSEFICSPVKVISYLRQIVSGRPARFLGHNPAGAAMIVLLLVSLLIITMSGIALIALEGRGPFADTLISYWPAGLLITIHEFFSDLMVLLIVVHIGGVLLSSYQHGENLIVAMLNGRKGVDVLGDNEE